MTPKNILKEFESVHDYWSPKVIGELNGQYLKIAKVRGEFVWHDHAGEDELFWIIKGALEIEMRDKTVTLKEGDIFIIPRSVEHKPSADKECWLALLEPKSTKHTGDVKSELTKTVEDQLKR